MAKLSKKVKLSARQRRKYRIRRKVSGIAERPRLSVFRSARHTHAQLIADDTGVTLATASTQEKEVMELAKGLVAEGGVGSSKSVAAAKAVGQVIAQRAKTKNVDNVVFDRNGFLYHGRIQAVADGAREKGLSF